MTTTMLKIATTHIRPAYGRSYETLESALTDFHANKDFVLAHTEDGCYVNKLDLVRETFRFVHVFLDSNETYGGLVAL